MGTIKGQARRMGRGAWTQEIRRNEGTYVALRRLLCRSRQRQCPRVGGNYAKGGRGFRHSWQRGKVLWPLCFRPWFSPRVRALERAQYSYPRQSWNQKRRGRLRQLFANLA